jgi:hypothetical protein
VHGPEENLDPQDVTQEVGDPPVNETLEEPAVRRDLTDQSVLGDTPPTQQGDDEVLQPGAEGVPPVEQNQDEVHSPGAESMEVDPFVVPAEAVPADVDHGGDHDTRSIEPMDTQSIRTRRTDVTMRTARSAPAPTIPDITTQDNVEEDQGSQHSFENIEMDVNWVAGCNLRLYLNGYD